jgi:flagellar basal body-associated protein FliL
MGDNERAASDRLLVLIVILVALAAAVLAVVFLMSTNFSRSL